MVPQWLPARPAFARRPGLNTIEPAPIVTPDPADKASAVAKANAGLGDL